MPKAKDVINLVEKSRYGTGQSAVAMLDMEYQYLQGIGKGLASLYIDVKNLSRMSDRYRRLDKVFMALVKMVNDLHAKVSKEIADLQK